VPRLPAALLLTTLLVASAGCSSSEEETPPACLTSPSAYLEALERAPGEVRLDGGTPISECLTSDQEPAELGRVGEAIVEAATELNAAARRRPAGEDTVRLGYLVGAVQRGASEAGGIHADLIRRLDAAARFSEGGEALPVSFERAFGRGYAAGQESG
jgi:hypothetical protein